MANGIDGEKPPPGLTSVASATGTPASIAVAPARSGRASGRRRPSAEAWRRRPPRPRGDAPRRRKSGDRPSGRRPRQPPASRRSTPARRRECAASGRRRSAGAQDARRSSGREDALLAEDVAPSGEPAARTAGIISSTTRSTYSARRFRYSSGTSWAPMKVATIAMACLRPSIRNHAKQLQLGLSRQAVAALDLTGGRAVRQHLVEARRRAPASADSVAARVAATVDTMPPPVRPRSLRMRPQPAAGAARRRDRRRTPRAYVRRRSPARRCAAAAGRRRLPLSACCAAAPRSVRRRRWSPAMRQRLRPRSPRHRPVPRRAWARGRHTSSTDGRAGRRDLPS